MKIHSMKIIPLFACMALIAFNPVAKADPYKIDPVHSTVLFKISHLRAGKVYGRFDKFSGTFNLDPADPSKDRVEVELLTDSLDSNSQGRDKDVKGPDFLNTAQFPKATFKSTSVKKVDDNHLEVTGDLTLKSVTKPITLNVEILGNGKGMKGETRQGLEATTTLNRSDFDIKYMLPALGDEVSLTLAIEGIKE
jgi:polyisoprenoid-binding protein YceI